jgi:hypothetical protein
MVRIVAGSLTRRISRLQLLTGADNIRSGPSAELLDLLSKLEGMSKEQLKEVTAWRDGIGDQFGDRGGSRSDFSN